MAEGTAEKFNVVVVGTGAAGLSAALAASVRGARVLVLEKASVVGLWEYGRVLEDVLC